MTADIIAFADLRNDARYVDRKSAAAVLLASVGDMDMGGWADHDEDTFRHAVRSEYEHGTGRELQEDDLRIVEADSRRDFWISQACYEDDEFQAARIDAHEEELRDLLGSMEHPASRSSFDYYRVEHAVQCGTADRLLEIIASPRPFPASYSTWSATFHGKPRDVARRILAFAELR